MDGLRVQQENTTLLQAPRNADSNAMTTISGTEPDVSPLHAIQKSATYITCLIQQVSAFHRERTGTPVNAKTDSTGGTIRAVPTRNLFR